MEKNAIEALKAAHPILEVLQNLGVEVRNLRFRCPRTENHAHGDRTPSVSVWPDRGHFKCWVCPDVKGDAIDAVRLFKGCGFRQALEFLGAGTMPSLPHAKAHAGSKANPSPRLRNPDSPQGGKAARCLPLPIQVPIPVQSQLHEAPDSVPPPSPIPNPPSTPMDNALRSEVLTFMLGQCPAVEGQAARYLQKRRIFKRTWDSQRLRLIADYASLARSMEEEFGKPALERAGFFNPAGHLRFYRHRLLFPYFDKEGKPQYLQARALEAEAKPKELSLAGAIPFPYNLRLLNGEPGLLYLCEGVIDTLTLLEQGFPAVGIPGAANFKPAWAPLFRGKSVHVAFDPDTAGDNGAAKVIDLLNAHQVEAKRLSLPKGKDLNDWFQRG